MPDFKFRLEPLLKLRDARRGQRRLALAEAIQAEAMLNQQADQLTQQLDEMSKRARVQAAPGKVNVDQLLSVHRYRLQLESQARILQQQETQLAGEVERRRQALVEADREVHVLEKLKARQRQEHRIVQQRQEAKELDEFAAQRWSRKQDAEK